VDESAQAINSGDSLSIVESRWPSPRHGDLEITVGFIGSGQIGSAIARLAIEAGHQVVLSNSRGPETLADLAAELGPRASEPVDDLNVAL
jgi:phosphoglycerate dehydrogenase-like enzyme